jgi:hypothetical protein
MNWVEIRIHRIFAPLGRFTRTDLITDAGLGRVLGFYENAADEIDRLLFCQEGICWLSAESGVKVHFDQIESANLNNEKLSDGLLLKMRNGDLIALPVRGRSGRALDVMEIYRFISRVLSDSRRKN